MDKIFTWDASETKISTKSSSLTWLSVCFKGVILLVSLNEETVDRTVYIEKGLPVALKHGIKLSVATRSFNKMVS